MELASHSCHQLAVLFLELLMFVAPASDAAIAFKCLTDFLVLILFFTLQHRMGVLQFQAEVLGWGLLA